MKDFTRVLFLGDIVGPLGREGVKKYLSLHKKQDDIDFVIANGENTTHGHGLSYEHYKLLLSYGVDCITSGNHYYNSPDFNEYDKEMDVQIRPINFDKNCPGKGSRIFTLQDGTKIRVSNAIGRIYISMSQGNPFYAIEDIYNENGFDMIHIVDFHAEATAEKRCFAEYLDSKVSAVIGTHTHVQTNDAKLLNKGTFFITDCGCNGAYDSSLGDEKESAMYRTITGMPASFNVPRTGSIQINAVLLDINKETKLVSKYQIINEKY